MYRNVDLMWSQQSMSVEEFLTQYKDDLPVLVRIIQDADSDGHHWKSINAIYRVHKCERQPRILARDNRNRLLSIPIEVPDKFQLIPTKGSQKQSSRHYGHNPRLLADIVGKEILPYSIKQTSTPSLRFHEGDEIILGAKFGELLVERVYAENFLVGNIISKGHMFPAVMVIPALLNIRVHVALGLNDGKSEIDQWLELQKVYADFAKEINFNVQEDFDVYVKPSNEPTPTYPTIPRRPSNQSTNSTKSDDGIGPLLPPRPLNISMDTLRSPRRRFVANTQSISSILDLLENEDPEDNLGGETSDWDDEMYSRALSRASRKGPSSVKPQAAVSPTVSSDPTPPPIQRRPTRTIVRRTTKKGRDGQSRIYVSLIDIETPEQHLESPFDEEPIFRSIEEVPEDISGLSVDEVGECLRLLNLGSVALLFVQRQVDGTLLKSLNGDTLKSEMGLTDFECSKLKSFVHDGWRPNMARRSLSVKKEELSLPADGEDTKL